MEDGIPPKRLPTGERRLRIRYKADVFRSPVVRSPGLCKVEPSERKPEADAAKQADGDLAIDTMEPEAMP